MFSSDPGEVTDMRSLKCSFTIKTCHESCTLNPPTIKSCSELQGKFSCCRKFTFSALFIQGKIGNQCSVPCPLGKGLWWCRGNDNDNQDDDDDDMGGACNYRVHKHWAPTWLNWGRWGGATFLEAIFPPLLNRLTLTRGGEREPSGQVGGGGKQ